MSVRKDDGGVLSSAENPAAIQRITTVTILTALLIAAPVALAQPGEAGRVQPYQANPYYWQYKGAPVLLLGGSDDDNLFQWAGSRLRRQLDLLLSAGGNYLRNTMSDRDPGNIYAFKKLSDGKYDLNQWNGAYWDGLDYFLQQTHQRGIIVQIEVWDAFDWMDARGWGGHPWNPRNNVNYTAEESGLPVSWSPSPHRADNPFAQTIPGLANAGPGRVVLVYQEKFVAKILEVCFQYDHVLFTIQNETSASHQWSDYWALFLHVSAEAAGGQVEVSDMREEDRPATSPAPHQYQIERPRLYTFLDISKNSRDETGEDHWKGLQHIRTRLRRRPRPMNSAKIVSRMGSLRETTERWWRNIIGGAAGERFHRPTINSLGNQHGLGLGPDARRLIRGAREVTDAFNVFTAAPRDELLRERAENEAYCLAGPGRQYAVYFPQAGDVTLDVPAATGGFALRWYDVNRGSWHATRQLDGANPPRLKTPGAGHWVALVAPR